MNLSCGNCGTIEPFSGTPPKCDVCGWVSGTKPTETAKRRDTKSGGTKLTTVVILAVCMLLLAYWLTSEKQQLANKYHVSQDSVLIDTKPHGCDFSDAPLGNKHCHYEKEINAIRACDGPDCPVKAVYVSWRKVSE